MSCGKAEQSPETIATFKKLRQISANKMCFDCNKKGASWASVHMGVFICLDCAGRHRQLGVHLSFVRSVDLDEWTEENRAKMVVSGNKKALEYMKKKGGSHLNSPNEFKQKYSSNAAQMYREQVLRDAKAYVNSGQKISEAAAGPDKPVAIGAGVDDFFSQIDGKPLSRNNSSSSINRSGSNHSLGPRSDSNSSVGNMSSPSARRGSSDVMMKSTRLPEDEWGDEDFTPTSPAAAAPEPAPTSPSAPKVVVVPKARSSGIGKKVGAKKKASGASKVTKVAKAVPAKVTAAKADGDDWGDMDGFDDGAWDKIKASSAQAEIESNRPPEVQFDAAKKSAGSFQAPEHTDDGHAIKITNKSFSASGGSSGHRVGGNIRAAPHRPPAAANKPAAASSEMQQKYGAAKGISSEQVLHGEDDGADERFQEFAGNGSLSSDQFFGRDDGDRGDHVGDLAFKLASETKQDLKKMGSQAKAFVGNMIAEYTQ